MAAEANVRAMELCTIEATVPTGFEEVAREEAVENFGTECRAARGKIVFQTSLDSVKNVSCCKICTQHEADDISFIFIYIRILRYRSFFIDTTSLKLAK